MQLLNDFFFVIETTETASGMQAIVQLNPEHIVYAAHFPGFPVTPGVVQLQMVEELLEHQLGRRLRLKNMPVCKFLKILNPEETTRIDIHLEWQAVADALQVDARGVLGAEVYFKLTAAYEYR